MTPEDFYVHGYGVGYDLFRSQTPVESVNYEARQELLKWTFQPRSQAEVRSFYNGVQDGYSQASDDRHKP